MAGQDYLDDLPEVVLDSRLEAIFGLDGQRAYTVHPEYTDLRAPSNQERWFLKRRLGSGGGGRVDLEIKESKASNGPPQLRAVKKVEISPNERVYKLHQRELVAIFKFSQPKYANLFVRSYGWFTSERYIHISMEYLELGDLQHYLSDEGKCPRHRLPEPEVHDISVQVLSALNAMHSVGFSHRDLKPANILIKSQPPQEWRVKLADFGISKRGGEITESTDIRGTKNFMAPELLIESSDKPEVLYSFAIDMWCFGQTIHRVLTGHNPFNSVLAIAQYWEGNAEFPTTALQSVGASEPVIHFLRSLMVADPTKRLTAKGGLSNAWVLMDFSTSNSGQHSNTPSKDSKPQANPAVGAILDQDTANEATASWTDVLPTRTSTYGIETITQSHETDGENSASWTEALGYSAASSPRITSQKTKPATKDKAYDKTLYEQHEDFNAKLESLGAEHPATISSMHALGIRLSKMGINKPAASVLRETLRLEKKVLGGEETQTLQTKRTLATTLEILEEYDECEVLYRELAASDKKNRRTNEPAAIQTLQSLGLLLYERSKFEESATVYEQCAVILREKHGQEDNLLLTLENLVRSCNMAGMLTKANTISREYISRHKNHVQRADEKILAITYLLASNLAKMDRHHEAEIAFKDARTITRILPNGRSHSLSPAILWGLGNVLYSQKRYPESELAMKEAIQLSPKPTGPDNLESLQAQSFLALVLEHQHKYDEAVLIKEEVAWETGRIFGPSAQQTWTAKQGLGRALIKADRLTDAENLFRQVTEDMTKIRGKNAQSTVHSAGLLAHVQSMRSRRKR
ncbi:unnamed protein product [Clonostachys chloroleuca]|uniref:mitogen-activated protein kinase kinase n=1 Tax=Clonostachys chloroleuca TaxID=1926264 RepID=A0AA35QCZ3_9HYPO|nr:unnamed protein product [Clonostachys chloroleuca]